MSKAFFIASDSYTSITSGIWYDISIIHSQIIVLTAWQFQNWQFWVSKTFWKWQYIWSIFESIFCGTQYESPKMLFIISGTPTTGVGITNIQSWATLSAFLTVQHQYFNKAMQKTQTFWKQPALHGECMLELFHIIHKIVKDYTSNNINTL